MSADLVMSFAPGWAYLSSGEGSDTTLDVLVSDAEPLGPEVQRQIRAYLVGLRSLLAQGRVAGLASMAHLDPPSGDMVIATCAIAVEPLLPSIDDPLAEVASAWRPLATTVIRSTTTEFEGALGKGVRTSTTRTEPAMAVGEESSQVIGHVRYVFPLDDETSVLLHFSTPSVVYLAELTEMFDAIAAAVRREGERREQVNST